MNKHERRKKEKNGKNRNHLKAVHLQLVKNLPKLTREVIYNNPGWFQSKRILPISHKVVVTACQIDIPKRHYSEYVWAKVSIKPPGNGKRTEKIIETPMPIGETFLLKQVYSLSQTSELKNTATGKILKKFSKSFPDWFKPTSSKLFLFRRPDDE